MRIGWSLLALLFGLLTFLSALSVIVAAITLQWTAITRALVCVGLFLLTRWAWLEAKARPGGDGDDPSGTV